MSARRVASRIGVGFGALALASVPFAASASASASVTGTGIATGTHAPHKAAATCSDRGCDGKDPQSTGCSQTFQARDIRTAVIMQNGKKVGLVELRWSPFCGNNWARVTSTAGPATLTATATRSDGAKTRAAGQGTVLWTPMIFGRDLCVSATGTVNGASATTACG